MPSVLVVSQDQRFLDLLGKSLQEEGMKAACAEEIDTAMAILEEGFRPDAVVIEPMAVLGPGGGALVRYLTESPALARVPVYSISPVVKRLELQNLIATLHRLGGAAAPCAAQ